MLLLFFGFSDLPQSINYEIIGVIGEFALPMAASIRKKIQTVSLKISILALAWQIYYGNKVANNISCKQYVCGDKEGVGRYI
jgi:hypothetical protein